MTCASRERAGIKLGISPGHLTPHPQCVPFASVCQQVLSLLFPMSECEGNAAGEPGGPTLFVTSTKKALLFKGLLHNPQGFLHKRNTFSFFLI